MKRKKRIIFLLIVPLLLLYILLFPIDLGRELLIENKWSASLDDIQKGPLRTEEQISSFRLGETFGFVSDQGRILFKDRVRHGLALTDSCFINYGSLEENQVIQDWNGKIGAIFEEPGYPFSFSNRLFILHTDNAGVSERDPNTGALLWKKRLPSLVTCFAANHSQVLIGLLNGEVFLLGQDGEIHDEIDTPPSRLKAVYGVSISRSGEYGAVLSGIDPQVLSVYQIGSRGLEKRTEHTLSFEQRHPVQLMFSELTETIYVQDGDSIGIFNQHGEDARYLEGQTLISLTSLRDLGLELLLKKPVLSESSQEGMELEFFNDRGESLWTVKTAGRNAFIKTFDNYLLLGISNSICFTVLRKG